MKTELSRTSVCDLVQNNVYTVRAIKGNTLSGYNKNGVSKKYVLYTPKLSKIYNKYGYQKVTWDAVVGAKGYKVYVRVNGKWKYLKTVTGTSYSYKSVKKGKSYTYTVVAINGKNKSGYNTKGITRKY